jgi:hypothetical protein
VPHSEAGNDFVDGQKADDDSMLSLFYCTSGRVPSLPCVSVEHHNSSLPFSIWFRYLFLSVGVAAVKLIWMSEVLSEPSSLVAGDL